MNLYEINTQLANYHMEFDELTGEWINEGELDALQMAKDEKVENLCLWVKNLKAEANAIKTEEQTDLRSTLLLLSAMSRSALREWRSHSASQHPWTSRMSTLCRTDLCPCPW